MFHYFTNYYPVGVKLAILSILGYNLSMSEPELTPENPPESTAHHYVDNEMFQAAMLERRAAVDAAKEAGLEKPQVSEYIGTCIYQIARHLAYKSNFIGYSYRDEMISDGIENCLRYLDNYDPYNYAKPFAYFTQINYYAFVRRITREKKQAAIKGKMVTSMLWENQFDLQVHDEDGLFTNSMVEFMQQHSDVDTSVFDKKKPKKSKKSSEPSLAEFVEDPVIEELADPDFEGLPIPEDLLNDDDS